MKELILRVIKEIHLTRKADFGSGCKWNFVDKFCFRWYRNYLYKDQ